MAARLEALNKFPDVIEEKKDEKIESFSDRKKRLEKQRELILKKKREERARELREFKEVFFFILYFIIIPYFLY